MAKATSNLFQNPFNLSSFVSLSLSHLLRIWTKFFATQFTEKPMIPLIFCSRWSLHDHDYRFGIQNFQKSLPFEANWRKLTNGVLSLLAQVICVLSTHWNMRGVKCSYHFITVLMLSITGVRGINDWSHHWELTGNWLPQMADSSSGNFPSDGFGTTRYWRPTRI